MALNLYGRANRWTRDHVVASAHTLGVPERATARMLDEVVDGVRSSMATLDSVGFDDRSTRRLGDFVASRCRELTR
ncbi:MULTISPECIES: hypothetical protein [unclassified Rhodococcus (in: high G+C Gram-positive bacteria)]|uniref:hypothetical protein n=1 Tax=unclassified Rhodococcus (in: high G+C Gram-positive bacteria) TaxID=192944 RepID=UPI0016AB67F9|nr:MULTISPECIES: hypothetical protein [unclassified Rhodococcus (in: high G+C Gram-positive bacteria)]NIL74975.1 hypothetical protein [Rhodococcus sp. B10]